MSSSRTGRPYRMAKDFYRELELHTPMINFNGSLYPSTRKGLGHEKCLTSDKKYLLDMVKRTEDIQAGTLLQENIEKVLYHDSNEEIADPKLFE